MVNAGRKSNAPPGRRKKPPGPAKAPPRRRSAVGLYELPKR